jgi:hypothetical protein
MEDGANWATRMRLYLPRRFALARDKCRAMKSRVNREIQPRLCEGLGVKFPGGYSTMHSPGAKKESQCGASEFRAKPPAPDDHGASMVLVPGTAAVVSL